MSTTTQALQSLLASIALPDCKPTSRPSPPAWPFPCGLVVADKFLWPPFLVPWLLLSVHQRHHTEGHRLGMWTFNASSDQGPDWYKVTVSCSCKP